jgi:hypothetical protein
MVIHVNDVATGEMSVLVGAREVVLRDPRLVAYFIEAARSSGAKHSPIQHKAPVAFRIERR